MDEKSHFTIEEYNKEELYSYLKEVINNYDIGNSDLLRKSDILAVAICGYFNKHTLDEYIDENLNIVYNTLSSLSKLKKEFWKNGKVLFPIY